MVTKRQWLIDLRGNKARKDVAKHVGITPQMLGMVERGERNPSLALAKKMADFYSVSVDDIANKIFLDRSETKCVQKHKLVP